MAAAADGEHLLRAILDEPREDVHRLIYADWLDENGEPERAEFIRCQIAVAAWSRGAGESVRYAGGTVTGAQAGAMLARSQALLDAPGGADGTEAIVFWADLPDVAPNQPWAFATDDFSRGFLWRVRCTLAAWREHGPAVVQAHPVTRVELSDRGAWIDGPEESSVYWWSLGVGQARSDCRWVLPAPVFDLLPGVASRRDGGSRKEYRGEDSVRANDAADDALSAALIAWAKPDLCRECGGRASRLADHLGYTHSACRRCGAARAGGK